jgi:hypothetical protein
MDPYEDPQRLGKLHIDELFEGSRENDESAGCFAGRLAKVRIRRCRDVW